jgi:hypothetical protein
MSPAPSIVIADRQLSKDDAVSAFHYYYPDTVARYDLPGPGDPFTLTRDEVTRTRVVNSRISNVHADWFVERGQTAPWPPVDANLYNADPALQGGIYDQMDDCYRHFWIDVPRGVNMGKISKVLHIKRPNAFPILDSEVQKFYGLAARRQAVKYPDRKSKRMFWAAVRDDLIINTESGALAELRDTLSRSPALQAYTKLTDLRLLDILTWR